MDGLGGERMTAADKALDLARRHGVTVKANGDHLRLTASKPPPTEVVDALRRHKSAVLAALNSSASQGWGGASHAIEWFLSSNPPAEPFVLKRAVWITDPAAYWQKLRRDIGVGPGVARDAYGAVRDELRRLYAMFAVPAPPNGPH